MCDNQRNGCGYARRSVDNQDVDPVLPAGRYGRGQPGAYVNKNWSLRGTRVEPRREATLWVSVGECNSPCSCLLLPAPARSASTARWLDNVVFPAPPLRLASAMTCMPCSLLLSHSDRPKAA